MQPSPMTLAQKLETLIDQTRKRDGSKYTQAEIIAGTGNLISRVYLWKLRTGRATKPGFQVIQALADFFGVEVG